MIIAMFIIINEVLGTGIETIMVASDDYNLDKDGSTSTKNVFFACCIGTDDFLAILIVDKVNYELNWLAFMIKTCFTKKGSLTPE